MESRKRLRTDDSDALHDSDSLEMFRKDAIYRRMKHYSRENERSQAKIVELERRRSTCEAGLAALEACWTQLVDTIRSVVHSDSLPPVDVETQDIFDLSAHVSEDSDSTYVDTLRTKMQATQQLVTAFVQLGAKGDSGLLQDEMYRRCQRAQTECTSLRSEVSLIRAKLRNAEEEKERLHEQLIAAEKRVDRLQSKTIAALYPPQGSASPPPPSDKEQHVAVKDESSPRDSPSSPAPSGSQPPPVVVNGTDDSADDWKEIAELREANIEQLRKAKSELTDEVTSLQIKMRIPPDDFIQQTHVYKVLVDEASRIHHDKAELIKEVEKSKAEIENLQVTHEKEKADLQAAYDKQVSEFVAMGNKRDTEICRLRDQRDQQLSELNERKQKDNVKIASLNEFKSLAESRGDRIKVLESEVTRLKTRLAAESGDEDLMTFLFQHGAEEMSYVEDLRQKLRAAEDRATSLEQSLSFFQEEHPDVVQHMQREVEAKQELAEVSRQLKEYRSTLSSLPPDLQSLTEQLKQKDEEIEQLKSLEKQREQAESSLYAELDRLSAAWEALDRQVKSKVFDLSAMEERVVKVGLDKAKSENKFYSAMRDKEAIENERKNLSRGYEKQTKLIEKFMETEKNLHSQISTLEKEVSLLKNALEAQKGHVKLIEHEILTWKTRAEGERKRADDMRAMYIDREHTLERQRADFRKQEESLAKVKRETEKLNAKLRASEKSHSGSTSSREAQLREEVEKCMTLLQCSTCKMNMRNTVITKCMHSFCRACVDSRISSRQRKCPACNLGFAQSDVQQLFFQ
ncbi:unnamed protein product [Somion occarium]|uniref:E3 ubiquitin protein ligase n=1 Tax=Somion occarium TaxID=3059160 RepID=A0ABP1DG87_9APHY